MPLYEVNVYPVYIVTVKVEACDEFAAAAVAENHVASLLNDDVELPVRFADGFDGEAVVDFMNAAGQRIKSRTLKQEDYDFFDISDSANKVLGVR